jgi:hypothetical protein
MRWLDNCIKTHPECFQDHADWRPNRLLQITESGSSIIKLILTKLEPPTRHYRPYLTLSHCWGKAKFLTLTNQTLPLLLEGVAISVLPKTFQDAINMTVFLGFEYLWIDSLCIMQDSIEDWKIESALMGDIYSNGVCNLAATGSADGSGGFWMDDSPLLRLPCEVEIPLDQDAQTWHIHPMYLDGATLLFDGPSLHRGWVIQERILAPRTLHFGSSQMFWECRHFQACETYPGGLPHLMGANKSNLVSFDALQKTIGIGTCDGGSALAEVDYFWGATVEGFSKCDLTKQEDKLVALSGLARKIQERHPNFDFIAGMLRQSLQIGLLWNKNGFSSKLAHRSTPYQVPSWSWASVDVDVSIPTWHWDQGNWQILNEILEVEMPQHEDPMGQTVSATVRIEGFLLTVGLRYRYKNNRTDLYMNMNETWNLEFNFFNEFPDVDEPFQNLHCLVMADKERNQNKNWKFWCLLIQPTGARKGEFRRYGVLSVYPEGYNLSALDDLKSVQNKEWLEYESVGKDGKYIVSII